MSDRANEVALLDEQGNAISSSNPLPVDDQGPTSGVASAVAHTQVGASATVVTLLAANTSRASASFFNKSTDSLFIKLGATATTSDYYIELRNDEYMDIPMADSKIYQGIITGIWSGTNGDVKITETT